MMSFNFYNAIGAYIGRNALVGAVGRMRFNFYDAVGAYVLAVTLILLAVLYYAEFKATRKPIEPK